jgi:predicted nucleic acid-binding protein
MRERLLLDTSFIQALLNSKDRHHQRAKVLLPRVYNAREVWVTEAVLVEVGNAFSAMNRGAACQFIRQCYQTPNIKVVSVDTALLSRALELYDARPDKDWGLTDCISFMVMLENSLIDAVMADFHFVQAGYRALLLEVV